MVFEYTVKYNGKRYRAGENVPMDEKKEEKPVVNETLEKAKEVFAHKVDETEKKSRGRKPKA